MPSVGGEQLHGPNSLPSDVHRITKTGLECVVHSAGVIFVFVTLCVVY